MELVNRFRLKDYIDKFYKSSTALFERKASLVHLTQGKTKEVNFVRSTVSKQIKEESFFVIEDKEGNAYIYQRKYLIKER